MAARAQFGFIRPQSYFCFFKYKLQCVRIARDLLKLQCMVSSGRGRGLRLPDRACQ